MPALGVAFALLVSVVVPTGFKHGGEAGSAACLKDGSDLGCAALLTDPGWDRPGCPWERYVPDGSADAQFELSMQVRDGVEWDLFARLCDSPTREYRWFPQLTSRDLAGAAYDSVSKQVPKPELHMSRPIDDLIVNAVTTIEVTPIEPVSVTARIPGLSATVTATASRIEVVTGSQVSTDVQRISCAPWGGADCSWTPVYPSVFKVTGTDDHRHHGSASIVWDVVWTSSNGGGGGDLGELTTTAPVEFAVREIQIIGG